MLQLQAAGLDHDRVAHGFFGRPGGISAGIYAGLNCGFGSADDRAAVAENRARVSDRIVGNRGGLLTVHQVHGTDVAVADEAGWAPTAAPKADVVVTDQPGVVIGVLAADCAPVLLADPVAGVVAAAHAGWRGALSGVVEAAIAAMAKMGARPERIAAAIGPCIGPASYEVGPEFRDRFVGEQPASARFFADGPRGRPHFDLPGYLFARVGRLGLASVDLVTEDTAALPIRWFSYRRTTLAGEPDYGRHVSAIALRG